MSASQESQAINGKNGGKGEDNILENGAVKRLLHTVVEYSPAGLINFIQPGPLEQVLTEKIEKAPLANEEEMEEIVKYVMEYSVNTSDRHFLNQLYNGVNPMGLVASVILEKMNTNAWVDWITIKFLAYFFKNLFKM